MNVYFILFKKEECVHIYAGLVHIAHLRPPACALVAPIIFVCNQVVIVAHHDRCIKKHFVVNKKNPLLPTKPCGNKVRHNDAPVVVIDNLLPIANMKAVFPLAAPCM